MERYTRQMLLSNVGEEGQKKLKNAKVLLVGAGGLGSPAALYLAGAGIGTLGILDADVVSLSNLHRQVMHSAKNVGMNKAESAKEELAALNDEVNVKVYPCWLTAENAEEILQEYDFILDAVDNFETKFLINDTCVLLGKPFCHGGVLKTQGQLMTYVPGKGPCYRCIFEEIPEKGSVPSTSEVGIIGPIVGMIGCAQAMEVLKYFLGMGELLTGKMYTLESTTMKSRLITFPKCSPNCRVCNGSIKTIDAINYQ